MATRLAITLGDPTGIGPEVALKALAVELPADDVSYIVIGDRALILRLNEDLQLGLDFSNPRIAICDPGASGSSEEPTPGPSQEGSKTLDASDQTVPLLGGVRGGSAQVTHSHPINPAPVGQTFLSAGAGDFPVARSEHRTGKSGEPAGSKACPTPGSRCELSVGRIFAPLPHTLTPGAPEAARAAVAWLEAAADLCLRGEVQGVVTAPVNKEAINRAGIPFIGQTEFFTERAGVNRTVMMLLGPDDRGRWLRVALATVHIALREVPVKLTPEKVLLAIERAAEACELLGLPRARVAVCGLNPHAGEGGAFGDEEGRIIDPAVQQARADGLDVVGPLSGDTVFHHALHGAYDAVVAMYHDQGLAPLKLAAFDNGVNWTLGLPFIRTSPDHGTAYDLAGLGKANPSSMISAIRLAKQLAGQR